MSWVDGVFLLFLIGAGVHGFRVGAAAELLAMGGLWAGLLLGVVLVPVLAGLVSGAASSLVALAVLVLPTAGLGAAGAALGGRVHRSLRRLRLGRADSALGVGVGLTACTLALWVLGTLLSASSYPSLNSALRGSALLRATEKALPSLPDLFARAESYLSSHGYPIVFLNLPPGQVTPAELPDKSNEAAFRAAQGSTVKVVGEACGLVETGSGFIASPDLVVTSAHVVAGELSTTVFDTSGSHAARVVVYDPRLDVAVLRVAGLAGPALPVRRDPVSRGTTAAIMGYPGGGSLRGEPAAVSARFQAVGLDIYGTTATTRSVYELNGEVLPGDSGGPLVASGQPAGTAGIAPGTVIGLVFASSSTTAHVGYALTMDAVSSDIAGAEGTSKSASTGGCVP